MGRVYTETNVRPVACLIFVYTVMQYMTWQTVLFRTETKLKTHRILSTMFLLALAQLCRFPMT